MVRRAVFLAIPFVAVPAVDAAAVLGRSSVTVGWNQNPESSVAGYKVLLGTTSGTFSKVQNVGKVTSHAFTGLSPSTTYYFAVQAYDSTYQVSELSSVLTFTIPEAVGAFDTWASNGGLGGALADTQISAFGDGVSNLVKFAFNLNASGPDCRVLQSGTGTAGLPIFTMDRSGAQPVFRVEYLERKIGGLVYTPKISTDLKNYSTMTGTTTSTDIDADWRRVKVQMNAGTAKMRFGRVDVTLPGLVVGP